jgi:hypothetical protein
MQQTTTHGGGCTAWRHSSMQQWCGWVVLLRAAAVELRLKHTVSVAMAATAAAPPTTHVLWAVQNCWHHWQAWR